MKLRICRHCNHHLLHTESNCPHCALQPSPRKGLGLAVLLGIGAIACNEGEKDSASDTASDTAQEPIPEPGGEDLYGVPQGDASEEMWTEESFTPDKG